MSLIMVRASNLELLNQAIDSGGLLDGCYCGLYTEGDSPNADSRLSVSPADGGLEEPTDISGYARQLVVWGSPANAEIDGTYRVVGERLEFFGDTDNPNTIKGYFLATGLPPYGDVIGAEEFDVPKVLADDLDMVPISPVFKVGISDNGSADVVDDEDD